MSSIGGVPTPAARMVRSPHWLMCRRRRVVKHFAGEPDRDNAGNNIPPVPKPLAICEFVGVCAADIGLIPVANFLIDVGIRQRRRNSEADGEQGALCHE